jgi:hypothetical protein
MSTCGSAPTDKYNTHTPTKSKNSLQLQTYWILDPIHALSIPGCTQLSTRAYASHMHTLERRKKKKSETQLSSPLTNSTTAR